ncbi:MAG TPA: TonB-dependent receptor [Niabella sp.]|nr:TonB-dependent receptor [Niabella sp.]HQW15078.1 TonB-dependent receptor [Niabella sp.]HQX20219.1 TonB-dependent receptor [Niabella sp.]HQX41298.1 TonB-dependent receptor [Niabella sp.]HRB35531.1 TonB-dependent receptor [Niabella sp.]
MKRIFMMGLALATQHLVWSQTDSIPKDSVNVLAPIEVRATRVNNKMPFAASNLQDKQISKQNHGANLPYLLGQLPSVVTSSDDGTGVGYSSLRIRGTDMTRINVTFNGIPVNDPESQGIFFVNTSDIASSTSSIQIQRGVGSSTNGAGAFGGSINISNIEQSNNASALVSNSYGSFNTWKHTIKAATGLLQGGFQMDIRLSKINSSGYIDRSKADLKSLQFLTGWTSKNQKTNIKFNLLTGKEKTGQAWNGIGVIFDLKDAAHIDYGQILDNIGRQTNSIGEMVDAHGKSSYYNDQTDNYQQDYYQLFINQKFNPYWTGNLSLFMTRGRGYYNEYKDGDDHDGEKFKNYGLPNYVPVIGDTIKRVNLIRQIWLDNYYSGTVFSLVYDKNKTNLAFGGAYTNYDTRHYGFIKWAQYGIPPDHQWYHLSAYKHDINFYSKWQQEIAEGLFTFLDLQVRNVSYNIHGFRKNPMVNIEATHLFFNPKIGINYLIRHDGKKYSRIFASYALANKEPNRDDFEAAPTQQPKPEHLQDLELGFDYSDPNWNAGFTGYYMKYKDQLILTGMINDVGAYNRTNVPSSYRAGIELNAGIKPSSIFELSTNAAFSRNKIKSFTQYSDDYDNGGQIEEIFNNSDIAFSPNVVVGATASFEPFYKPTTSRHFFIDIIQKYVSRQYLDNTATKFKSINPYALTDLRLRYHLSSKLFREVSITGVVSNIFNRKYENNGYTYSYLYDGALTVNNFYFPQAGTNWNVGISFGF